VRRAVALLLVLVVVVAAVVLLLRPARSGPEHVPTPEAPQHEAATSGSPPIPAPLVTGANAATTASPPLTIAAFNRRLRCVDMRQSYARMAPTDVLALLCQRKPLAALAIEVPLAEAGDVHAIAIIGGIANNGGCNDLGPPSAGFRARAIERAQKNGASAETVRRLDGRLAEEEQGPTPEELAACRQATDELKKLLPEFKNQVTELLGHALDPAKGADIDSEIEYRRRTLMAGDAEGAEELANALLSKDTPESRTEAVALLRDAARTSASAKAQLAACLLHGCPTADAEPDEAVRLLTAAASEGNLQALLMLTSEQSGNDPLPLPAADRYAWDQMLQKLNEEGCFGASGFYMLLIRSPTASQNLRAMSPADAEAAQARARELLGAQLEPARTRLGCN
jgi:hypothetical protein